MRVKDGTDNNSCRIEVAQMIMHEKLDGGLDIPV
jgi:hypothetical protein